MVTCGAISDRLAKDNPGVKPRLASGFALGSAVLFGAAFFSPPGLAQLVLLGLALFIVAAVAGIAGAMVANLTPRAIHGTAMATLALANNLLGLAPGPLIVGWLADHVGLMEALRILPIPCLLSAACFTLARRGYTQHMTAPASA